MGAERERGRATGRWSAFGRPDRWSTTIALVVVASVGVAATAIGIRSSSTYPFLLPWIVLSAAVLAAIVVTAPADRRDDALDPIVVAIATYFAPFVVVGALLLAGGWATPFYLDLVTDARHDLPLTLLYLLLGIIALAIGSRLAVASRVGHWADRRCPSIGLTTHRLAVGLIALHIAGLAAMYWAFQRGLLGYQVANAGRSGALPAYLATVIVAARIGVAMLWTMDQAPRRPLVRLAAAVSFGAVGVEIALGASRATVVIAVLSALFGAIAAGWRPRAGRVAVWLSIGSIVVASSIVFATTFRALKSPAGRERTVSSTEQLEFALDAVGRTLQRGPRVIPDAFDVAAERLDATGQAAVVVSRYRTLGAEERAAGIDNSVVDALIAGAVPRLVWPGKPDSPDPRVLAAIYFEFGENSFATTPMTDLLRNFGPLGVPLGMAVLGVGLGVLGVFRRCRRHSIATNMVVGAVLIRGVSYEGFYGALISDSVRIGLVATVAALLLKLMSTGRPAATDAVEPAQVDRSGSRRAAIVSVDLSQRGGHQAVAAYLHDCLERQGWTVSLISLATSSRDRNSMRVLAPRSWRSPTVTDEAFDGRPYRHVGCWLAELPLIRARPRVALDRELAGHDLIVLGVGPSFWALAIPPDLRSRTIVEFATRYDDEVVSALETATGWRRAFWRVQRRVAAAQERRALATVAAVIVPSDELATWAISRGAHDATVVAHAIGDRFEPDPAAVSGPTIVAVARWTDPRKNLALLLAAYGRALDVDGSIGALTLIGTPPAWDEHESLATQADALGDRVRFLGEVTQPHLVEVLQTSRMLVLASDQEGFGLPLVEAMACGCPVIATRSGGSELTVIDGVNGLLVPRRDEQALADAIVRLANDDELRLELSTAAHRSAGRYRIDAIAPVIGAIAQRVVQDASPASLATRVEA